MDLSRNHGLDLGIITMKGFLDFMNKAIQEEMTLIDLRNQTEELLRILQEMPFKDKQNNTKPKGKND